MIIYIILRRGTIKITFYYLLKFLTTMKKVSILFIALMGMLAASCSNDESLDSSVNLSNEQAQAPVTVSVSGFAVGQEEFPDASGGTTRGTTRATAVSDYTSVKFLTLAFYKSDGTEQFKVTQNRDDATTFTTFGEFSTSLPLGSYTMVVLGYVLYDDDALTLTSPTQAEYTVNAPRERPLRPRKW